MLTRAPAGLQLLERDTGKRLGVTGNIRTHPFFKTINWTLLEKRAVEPPFKPKVVCDPTLVGAASLVLPTPTAFQGGCLLSCPVSLLHLSHAFLLSFLVANLASPESQPLPLHSHPLFSLSHSTNTGGCGFSHPLIYIL